MYKYTGINFVEQQELNVFQYWLYLRDAVIYYASQTDEGKEWLEKCWAQSQTEPDRKMLREYFGRPR